jgi:hypothetical protein
MRLYKLIARRALKPTHDAVKYAWSMGTNPKLLTLLIAIGTLIIAMATYQNGTDTHEQLQVLKRQVEFNSTETRPFLRVKSTISRSGKGLQVFLNVINVGKIPGRVLAYDLLVQVGSEIIEPKGRTFTTHDILYPDQSGLGVFATLTEDEGIPFIQHSQPLIAAGCVIYGSITVDDTRRWRVSAAYRFDSITDEIPKGLFANEVSVPTAMDRCDAHSVRDEWASLLKLHAK